MKLEFDWKSSHSTVLLRFVRASGDDVKVLDAQGNEIDPPSQVHKGTSLHIAPRFVAYGGSQDWLIRIYVDDVSNTTLTDFGVNALYDDTVEPAKTEDLAKDEDVEPNKASDHEKTLTIPARTP